MKHLSIKHHRLKYRLVKPGLLLLGLFSLAGAVQAAPAQSAPTSVTQLLAPYPAASTDQLRHVIFLTPRENADNYQVELTMGKQLKVDCNRHMLGGTLVEKTVEGWGYSYFVLQDLSPTAASTMMACADDKKNAAFVPVASATRFVRYNSQLPIVIYTPKNIEVRYRTWNTSDQFHHASVK